MPWITHMQPAGLLAAPRRSLRRLLQRRPTRLLTPIRTTATGRYWQRIEWLFGGP